MYNLAYGGATSEGPQAERMGQTLLVNQFVTSLCQDLKRKLIGTEGGLEELVLKAWFEEAKTRELGSDSRPRSSGANKSQCQSSELTHAATPPTTTDASPPNTESSVPSRTQSKVRGKCFACGMEGHWATNCPYKERNRGEEARGQRQMELPPTTSSTMSALIGEGEDSKTQLEQLDQWLQDLERKFVQKNERGAILNTVAAEPGSESG